MQQQHFKLWSGFIVLSSGIKGSLTNSKIYIVNKFQVYFVEEGNMNTD